MKNINNFIVNYKKILSKYLSVSVVVVTKYLNPEEFKLFVCYVQKNWINNIKIGENRVLDAENKFLTIPNWLLMKKCLIWHLQTNKVKKAVKIFDIIKSVDSLYLAEEISKQAKNIWKIQDIYLQINISNEDQKYWFKIHNSFLDEINDGFISLYSNIKLLSNIRIIWLMCIAENSDFQTVEKQFKLMKKYFDYTKTLDSNLKYLSMWMSWDYELAIQNWSNEIRIWSLLFNI